jgi:hypothetical protein
MTLEFISHARQMTETAIEIVHIRSKEDQDACLSILPDQLHTYTEKQLQSLITTADHFIYQHCNQTMLACCFVKFYKKHFDILHLMCLPNSGLEKSFIYTIYKFAVENKFRPTNIQNEHLRCSSLYDLSASLAHYTIKNGHFMPVFNVHGSKTLLVSPRNEFMRSMYIRYGFESALGVRGYTEVLEKTVFLRKHSKYHHTMKIKKEVKYDGPIEYDTEPFIPI